MPHAFSSMFELAMPWWQFVLRACVVYFILLMLIRASGKRTMGQFTPFDMLLVVLLGNAVQNGINGGDNSLTGAAIMATTLIALNYGVAFVTSRNRKVEKFVEGVPVVLARNGKIFDHVLRRELVSREDFREALRMNGVEDVSEVELALLETNGSISVVKKRDED